MTLWKASIFVRIQTCSL